LRQQGHFLREGKKGKGLIFLLKIPPLITLSIESSQQGALFIDTVVGLSLKLPNSVAPFPELPLYPTGLVLTLK